MRWASEINTRAKILSCNVVVFFRLKNNFFNQCHILLPPKIP